MDTKLDRREEKKESLQNFGKYGWIVVIYILLMFWFYVGMVNDGSNFTAPAFSEKTGIDYSLVIGQGSVAGIIGVVLLIIGGKINEKIGATKTSGISMIILGITYIILGRVNTLTAYTACLSIMTGTAMTAGYISGGTLTTKWFPKKKGIAMGWTSMGHNLASAFYVPLIGYLVGNYGLGKGVITPGIGAIAVGILGLIIIRDEPFERGQYPDNVSKEVYEAEYYTGTDEKGDSKAEPRWTTAKLLKDKNFWLSAVTTGLIELVSVGVMTQLVIRLTQMGLTEGSAVSTMTVVALIGVFGSWAVGVLEQKIGSKKAQLVSIVWYAVALGFNLMETQWSLYISIFMIGMSIGGANNFTTSLPADVFGRHEYEKVNSVIFPIQGLVISMNFLVTAISLKLFGSLRGAYASFIGILAINFILTLFVDERKYNLDYQAED